MVAKTADVDGPDLLDKDPRRISLDHYLGAEARRACASRRRGDEDN
jgi:hypothetical protein